MKTLVIMAAGMGSRYGGLKQMDGFGPHGETILEYSIYDAVRAGFEKIVFVIRRDFSEQFTQQLLNPLHETISNVELVVVYQDMDTFVPAGHDVSYREKPRGTGHAVLAAKNEISGPFCVINADDRYGPNAYATIAAYFDTHVSQKKFAMVGYILENTLSPYGTVNRGICSVTDGVLNHVDEHLKIKAVNETQAQDENGKVLDSKAIVSMNFWGFDQSHITIFQEKFEEFVHNNPTDPKKEFYIPSVVEYCIQDKGYVCDVLTSQDPRCGVTYQEDKPFVEETITAAIESGMYPQEGLWNTKS